MKAGISIALAIAVMLGGCQKEKAAEAPVATPNTPAPAAGWAGTTVATPEGGFLMGNPAAPLKLVEYASLTCPHCAAFAAEGFPKLKSDYVASGKVSLEVRNFVRDPADLAAALLSRCSGAGPYFKLTEQLFAAQNEWLGKLQALTKARQQELDALPPERQVGWIATAAGLDAFVRQRGITADQAAACLSDKKAQDQLVAMRDTATKDYNLSGTPTFLLNGEVITGADWAAIEPQLKGAG